MIWQIASIPFWIAGIVIVSWSSVGLYASFRMRFATTSPSEAFGGFLVLMCVAGAFLWIAAKVAS